MGISFGDSVAALKLLKDCVKLFCDARGAGEDVQDLGRTLKDIDTLLANVVSTGAAATTSTTTPLTSDDLELFVQHSRPELERLKRLKEKYEATLGENRSKHNGLKVGCKRLWWGLKDKQEAIDLKTFFLSRLIVINSQLGVENRTILWRLLELTSESHKQSIQQSAQTRTAQTRLETMLSAQQYMIVGACQTTSSYLDLIIRGGFRLLQAILHYVKTTDTTTRDIYDLLQRLVRSPDARFSYTQRQICVVDACGKALPIPPEADFLTIKMMIQAQFHRDDEGFYEVRNGRFLLFYAANSDRVIRVNDEWTPMPGLNLHMAVARAATRQKCQNAYCRSTTILEVENGGLQCGECGMWFKIVPTAKRATYIDMSIPRPTISELQGAEIDDLGRVTLRKTERGPSRESYLARAPQKKKGRRLRTVFVVDSLSAEDSAPVEYVVPGSIACKWWLSDIGQFFKMFARYGTANTAAIAEQLPGKTAQDVEEFICSTLPHPLELPLPQATCLLMGGFFEIFVWLELIPSTPNNAPDVIQKVSVSCFWTEAAAREFYRLLARCGDNHHEIAQNLPRRTSVPTWW